VSGVCVFAARTCGISFGAVGGRGDRISVGISFGAVGNIVFFLSSHACGGGGGRRQYNIFPIFPCVRRRRRGAVIFFLSSHACGGGGGGAVGNIKKFFGSPGYSPCVRAADYGTLLRARAYPLRPSPRAAPNRMCVRTVRLRAYCAYVLTHPIAPRAHDAYVLTHPIAPRAHDAYDLTHTIAPRAHGAYDPSPRVCTPTPNIRVISTIADIIVALRDRCLL
jgi:hypothetical protein